MSLSLEIGELRELFPDARFSGNCNLSSLSGISNLNDAKEGELSFLGNRKYRGQVRNSRASVLMLPHDFDGNPRVNQIFIRMKNPSQGLARVCSLMEKKLFPSQKPGIHASAVVEEGAEIDENSSVGAFSFIGKNAKIEADCVIGTHCHVGSDTRIGKGSRLHHGVKLLTRCEIGSRVVLNAGVVVGSEGYGFEQSETGHQKIPHLGIVTIEDDVEIGANTCIDRARFENTVIGQGTKIDNLVQIGHNVRIGKRCLIVAQVGISGSVIMEDDVLVGGQAGFAGHLRVGKGAKIAGQAGITKDVEPGAFLKGNPALPIQLSQRISVLQRRLPELFRNLSVENLSE